MAEVTSIQLEFRELSASRGTRSFRYGALPPLRTGVLRAVSWLLEAITEVCVVVGPGPPESLLVLVPAPRSPAECIFLVVPEAQMWRP